MSLSHPKDAILNSLHVRSGGLRLSDTSAQVPGMVRFNPTTKVIEAYTGEDGPLGETWRELTLDIATSGKLGGMRVGSNMTIQSNGVVSSIAEGLSRLTQHVITVSKVAGKGDYQTLTAAIAYLDDLITGNDSDQPSATNAYKILVSPGVYVESITLPDYVSLQGEGEDNTIVRATTGDTAIVDSAVITLGTNSILEDLTIQHYQGSSTNSVGLYSSSESGIILRNIKITMGNTSGTAGTDVYAIYLTSCTTPTIENTTISVTQGTGDLHGIYCSSTNPYVFNTRITIDAPGNNNYGVYHASESNGEYRSCNIISKSGTNNVGLKNDDSMAYCYSCNILADAQDSNSDTAYGIENESSGYLATVTSSLIAFVARSSDRDDITITGTDFLTEGFETGKYIQVTGASNAQNNETYLVDYAGENTLTLCNNNEVITESAGSSITINQFYTIKLDYCVVRGTSSSIKNTPSTNHYAVRAETSTLLSADVGPQTGTGLIYFQTYQTITVSRQGGDYPLLSEAIDSINDNTQYRRYVIVVRPGIYTESASITLKDYVNIVGSGLDNTLIKFDLTSSTLASSAAIVGSSNSEISDISFQNLHSTAAVDYGTAFYASSETAFTLRRVGIQVTGVVDTTNYGLYLTSCTDVTLDGLEIIVNGATISNYGLKSILSTIEMSACVATISGASTTGNYAIDADRTTLNLIGSKITVSGSTGTNRGVNTTNVSGTEYLTQFFSSNILASGSGNYCVYTADNQTILGGGSRLTGARYYNGSSGSQSVMRLHGCWNVTSTSGDVSYFPLSTLGVSLSSTNGNLFLGDNAGNPDITGTGNTALGTNAGSALVGTDDCTLVGSEAGNSLVSGDNNNLYGKRAGYSLTTGSKNVLVGTSAGFTLVGGDSNVGVGHNALLNTSSGDRNIAIGDSAGLNLNGADSICIGNRAGLNASGSTGNIFIGSSSGSTAPGSGTTTGDGSVVIGYQSGYTNQTGSNIVALGRDAARLNTVANGTFIGSYAGTNAATGLFETFVGHKAGFNVTSGDYNTLLGAQAGYSMSTGGFNVIGGTKAAYGLTTGARNVVLGAPTTTSASDAPGYAMTTATDNIILGSQAAKGLTTGTKHVVLGVDAASSVTTGANGVTIGYSAGSSQTTQTGNIFLGYHAGKTNNNSGSDLIMIGSEAGANSDCGDSIFIGKESGQYSSGSYNIAVGIQSGKNQSQGTGSGISNIFVGHFSGRNIQTGSRNSAFGGGTGTGSQGVLSSVTSGTDNTAMGYLAGRSLTSNRNTLMGSYSGNALVNGGSNTMVGYSAGRSMTAGTGNVMAGDQAGYSLTTGISNVFLGRDAGYTSVNSSRSVAIGHGAGYTNSSGTRWIAVGHQAGYNNLANGTIAMGYHAGRSNTSGLYNIFVGYLAGIGGIDVDTEEGTPTSMTGGYNIVMGYKAGYKATTATRNIMMGSQAGYSATTAARNILIGDNAGYSLTTAGQNVFIGSGQSSVSGVGYSTTTGAQSIMIGYEAGKSNTTGLRHIYIGPQAAENAVSGQSNIAMGYRAANQMTDASFNVYIGYDAGYYNTSGGSNICIGYRAGRSGTSATAYTGAICIGREAGYLNDKNDIIFVGYQAGYSNTDGCGNISIGRQAGYANSSGDHNINVGFQAGRNTVTSDNIFVGFQAGYTNSTGDKNVAIGYKAGYANSTGNNSIFFGSNAGENTVAGNNVCFGAQAGQTNSSGTRNVYFGYRAGKIALSSNNVIFGSEAGRFLTSGGSNMFVGYQSGFNTTTGGSNFFVGYQSGFNNTTGATNTMMGYQAGYSTTTGGSNLYLGYQAGYYGTTGGRNLAIGYRSQRLNVTGNKNVSIGKYALYGNSYGDNNLAIGPDVAVVGDIGNNNLLAGPKAAQVIKNPSFADNIVMGYQAGLQGYAYESSIVMGSNAGNKGAGGVNNIIMGKNAAQNLGKGVTATNASANRNAGLNTIGVGSSFVKKGQYLALIHVTTDSDAPQTAYTVSVSSSQCTLSATLTSTLTTSDTVHLMYGTESSVVNTAVSASQSYVIVKTPKGDMDDLFTVGENVVVQSLSANTNEAFAILSMAIGTGSSGTGTTRVNLDSSTVNAYVEGDILYSARTRADVIGETDTSVAASNVMIGTDTGGALTTGAKNLGLGDSALRAVTTQKYNIGIGTGAGRYASSSHNTFIGPHAGFYVDSSSNGTGKNTMIGFCAGYYTGFDSSATGNLVLGNRAGQINQGSNNIILGHETNTMQSATTTGNTTYTNKLIIYKSDGGIPNNPLIGGDLSANRVGIKTLTPKSSFEVAGSFGQSIDTIGVQSSTIQYGSSYTVYWDKVDTTATATAAISGFPTKGNVLAGSEYIYFGGKNTSNLTSLTREIYGSAGAHLAVNTKVYNIGVIRTTNSMSCAAADSGSTMGVASDTNFSSAGLIVIDSEIIQYSGKGGGLGAVTRGVGGSTAALQASGSTVYSIAVTAAVPTNTTLTAAMTSGQTVIPMNPSTFANGGQLAIGSEIVSYVSNTPKLFTVTRGTNSTTGASHTASDSVYLISTATTALSSTSLVGDLTALTTSVQGTSLDSFTSSGFLIVDQEIVKYNNVALRGMTRGTNTTTNVNHGTATEVYLVQNSVTALSPTSVLDGSINDSQTSVTLDDGSSFTSSGTVVIGSEVIDYTGKSGNILTGCTRGVSANAASLHDVGDTVYQVGSYITSGVIDSLTSGATTLTFDSGHASFTGSGTLLAGTEFITYTSIAMQNLTRGESGTTAAIHSSGATLYNFSTLTTTKSLDSTINSSTTDVGVDTTTSLTTNGTVLIGAELITYSSGVGISGATRSISGTTAAVQASGSKVFKITSLLGAGSRSTLGAVVQLDESALPIATNTNYNSSGTLLVGSEIMTYTNKETLDSVTRGTNSTAAAAHTSGAVVRQFASSNITTTLSNQLNSGEDGIILTSMTSFGSSGEVAVENLSGNTMTTEIITYQQKNQSLANASRAIYGTTLATHTNTSSSIYQIVETGNNTTITLAATSAHKTLILDDSSGLSSSGIVRIGVELIHHGFKDQGLKVTRGHRSSTAASHTSGSTAYNINTHQLVNFPANVTGSNKLLHTDTAVPSTSAYVVSYSGATGIIRLDNELISYGSKGNSLVSLATSSRGVYSSTAASHNIGATVSLISTSGSSAILVNTGSAVYIGSDYIPIADSTGFASSGSVRVGREAISYTSKDDTIKLDAGGRGYFGSTAATHTNGTSVYRIDYSAGVTTTGVVGSSAGFTTYMVGSSTVSFGASGTLLVQGSSGGAVGELVGYAAKNKTLVSTARGSHQSSSQSHTSASTTAYPIDTSNGNISLLIGIDGSQTEIPLLITTSGGSSQITASGYLALDEEFIRYTNKQDYVFNVERNACGSSTASHSDGAVVNKVRAYDGLVPLHDSSTIKTESTDPYVFTSATRGTNSTSGTTHSSGAYVFTVSTSTSGLTNEPLNALATSGSTTLSLGDTSNFSPGGGTVVVDSEIIDYAGKTASTLTGLTRGVLNSDADAHANSSTVYIVDASSTMEELTMSGGVNNSATTVPWASSVAVSQTIPSSGTLLVDSELITYTVIDRGEMTTSNTLFGRSMTSVTRGQYSTTANAYSADQLAYSLTASTTALTSTTLASPAGTTDLTISLTSISGFSTASGFVLINAELIHYVDTSGNYIKRCTRAWDLTTAATHSGGDTVYKVIKPKSFYVGATTSAATTVTYWPGNCPIDKIGTSGHVLVGAELIKYTGTTGLYTYGLTGCTRGALSSAASAHDANDGLYYLQSGTSSIPTKTIVGAHTSGATSFFVNSSAGLSTSGYLAVGNEIIRHRGRSALTLTAVTRGILTTTPAAHSSGATAYYTSTIPIKMYMKAVSSAATTVYTDTGPGLGVAPTSVGTYWVDGELITATGGIGYNPSTFDNNSSFAVTTEICDSTQVFNYSTVNFYSHIYESGSLDDCRLVGATKTTSDSLMGNYTITNYSAGTTITLDTSGNAFRFPATGGFVALGGTVSDINATGFLIKYRIRSGKQLQNCTTLRGTTFLGDHANRVHNFATNALSPDAYTDGAADFGTYITSITRGDYSKIPVAATLLSITNTYHAHIDTYELDGVVNHSVINRAQRGTAKTTLSAGKAITRVEVNKTNSLNAAINTTVTDIPMANGAIMGSSGYALMGSEFIRYNDAHGIKGVTRAQLNSTGVSHLTGLSYYQYELGSNTTTLRINIDNAITHIPITSTTGFTSASNYLLVTTSKEPEVLSGGSWTRSFDTLTRGELGTTGQAHGATVTHQSVVAVTAPSTLRAALTDTSGLYIPLTSGTSYDGSTFSNKYLLIDSEFVNPASRESLEGLTRNLYSTSTVTLTSGLVAFYISGKNDYSTMRQNITANHLFLPLSSAASYTASGGVVLVEGEWVSYSSKQSFDVLTRGQYGTTSTSHSYTSNSSQLAIINSVAGSRTLRYPVADASVRIVSLNGANTSYRANSEITPYIVLVDQEYMKIDTYNTLDLGTRGYIGTTASSHIDTSAVTEVTSSGLSTLRAAIATTSKYVPASSANNYSTSGIGLIDAEFFHWNNKNSLDVLTRGVAGTSDVTHVSSGTTLVTNTTTPDLTPPYFSLTSNKVLLSDDISGIKINSTSNFPQAGTLLIGSERISFATKKVIADVDRATNLTTVALHTSGTRAIRIASTESTSIGSSASTLSTLLSSGATVISLVSASAYTAPGTVIIGPEIITFNAKSGNNLTNCSRGKLATTISAHAAGLKVLAISDTGTYTTLDGAMTTTQRIIPVVDNVNFGTSGTVLIDSEVVTYTSTNALGKLTRAVDATAAVSYANGTSFTLTDLTIGEDHSSVLLNTTAGNLTADLPAASTVTGRVYTFKKTSSDANTAAITPNASETIDGDLSKTSTAHNAFLTIQCDGTGWKTISHSSSGDWA